MKTTDYSVDTLRRALRDEATWMRERAKRLDALATNVTEQVKSGIATVHTFEFVAQEAVDLMTHRSNVFPQTLFRATATCAAEAAVEWVEQKRIEEMDAALAVEQGR